MPTTSIDTFFACTIILAAALIGTVFVASTLQLQINDSQEINKQSYLNALADHIVNSPGTPSNWGTTNATPSDFGLAPSSSQRSSELDVNKLNRLYNSSLPFSEFAISTNTYNTAVGLKVSQILDITLQQSNNSTNNHITTFTFDISTSINSKPTSTILHAYTKTNNFLHDTTINIPENGNCNLSIEIPEPNIESASLIVFARATIDDRITSYGIYNFNNSNQEFAPTDSILTIDGPINGKLEWTSNNSSLTIEKAQIFSFGYAQNLSVTQGSDYCLLPNLVDSSPQIIILNGHINGNYFQTWTANPRIPLEIGSDFNQSEQNIFSYLLSIKENLYNVKISFGDIQL
jgi:hypothetical protein